MDVIRMGHTSLKKANKSWNILLTSFFDHLNAKIKNKNVNPHGVLIE
jgi:hypothetical protein